MSLRSFALLIAVSVLPATVTADDAWLEVRLDRPGRLLDHDLVTLVRDALVESPDYRDRLDTPEMQRLDGGRVILEETLGVDWRTGLDRLFRHAELRSFDPRKPQQAVLVVQSDSRETLAKFLAAIADRQPGVRPVANDAAGPATETPDVRKLGQAFVAIDGPRLIVSPIEQRVRDAIGQSLDTSKEGDGPVLRANVDLTVVRELPMFGKGLQLPARDPGAVATIGGWMDHLLRGRSVSLELDTTDAGLTLTGRLESDAAGSDAPRVAGYFAPANEPAPAPLEVRGAILSASWFADYARMWEDRRSLVAPEVADRMEKRDEESAKELEVLGLRRKPSEVVGLLGTHYHVVVLRGGDVGYDVDLKERLPRATLAVSLRDADEFRATLEPVFRFFGAILAGEQKLLVTTEDGITSARFRDDPQSRGRGNRLRYHLSPSWTITDRHFVIGTTRSAVTDVLPGLKNPPASTPNTTSSSVISLSNAADAVDDARTLLVNRAQLDQGVTSRRAEAELNVFRTILRTLDGIRTRTTATDDTIEVTIEIGRE